MPRRIVYILAASHSGSTLLAMLLGAHRDACSVGELTLLPHAMGDVDRYSCSCGALIRECTFWRRVSEAMDQCGFAFDIGNACTAYRSIDAPYVSRLLRPLHRGRLMEILRDVGLQLSPAWRKRLPVVQQRVAALVASIQDITGASVVVDSSKSAVRLKYLLRNPDLDVKVIRLIRDGRGVALTYTNPGDYADANDPDLRGGGHGRPGEQPRAMHVAASEWLRCNQAAEAVLARLAPSEWHTVRYEELCTDTDNALGGICEFLDMNPSQFITPFRSAEHHVVGNGMRLDSSSDIRLDDRWRTILTAQDLQQFDDVAGSMNRRYGYE